MEGVVNEPPVLTKVPPEAASYHWMVDVSAGVVEAAAKVTVPVPQIEAGVVEMI